MDEPRRTRRRSSAIGAKWPFKDWKEEEEDLLPNGRRDEGTNVMAVSRAVARQMMGLGLKRLTLVRVREAGRDGLLRKETWLRRHPSL